MREHNPYKISKDLAQHFTPKKLREWLANKVIGNNITILEPAIGSGQLLFELNDRIQHADGYDVDQVALTVAKNNFDNKVDIFHQDFITSEINKNYDYAIANYPFSLKPTQEQKEAIAKDNFLKQFYIKNSTKLINDIDVNINDVKGVLDFVFILKSFNYAQEGHYLAFPGIGYRQQEEKFRKYLIENKYIKEFGIINNCKFDYTSIPILYLHLTKTPNETTKTFNLDLKTYEIIEKTATFENNRFDIPTIEIEKELLDPIELEISARQNLLNVLLQELKYSQLIYKLDKNLQNKLPSIEKYKQLLIHAIYSV